MTWLEPSPADRTVFTLPLNAKIISIIERHSAAASDGGAVSMQVRKLNPGQALANGTDMLPTPFDMKGDADVPQNRGVNPETADCVAGTALALDYTGTLTDLANVSVAVVYQLI